ncbi:MAG TPA: hypothetical protein PKD64_04700 [Pirellulaceae bacterium]|nr:hypothetical protein [Pirellulaceae bacterium]HMO91473.1 hypothetical protein [Pirellulaceae bacterium]
MSACQHFVGFGALAFALAMCGAASAFQDQLTVEIDSAPKEIPMFRPSMKGALERLKSRTPRLPWPPNRDEQNSVNNGLFRSYYLPEEWGRRNVRPSAGVGDQPAERQARGAAGGDSSRRFDEDSLLDNGFKVRMFWIVSRVNNCHYCLGHQELKLIGAGMVEDEIARLDFNWDFFPISEQVAFAFTRKLTATPHLIAEQDVRNLKQHFTDDQIVELIQTVAGFNSTNRWTDSLGIPQDDRFREHPADFSVPTSDDFANVPSSVALTEEPERPTLESRDLVLKRIADSNQREPAISLRDLSEISPEMQQIGKRLGMSNYARALGAIPNSGLRQLQLVEAIRATGRLPSMYKSQIFWAVSRENRAWYSIGHARKWLQEAGLNDDQIFALDARTHDDPKTEAALNFARKLTCHSRQISDKDIHDLRERFTDHEVAEIVFITCFSNMFNFVTEPLNLPLESQ